MELVTMAPRPAPNPNWVNVELATAAVGGYRLGVTSTGAIGRAEGYTDRGDALRAARMLTRGADRDAAAVLSYESRWYVQGVRVVDRMWGRIDAPLAFEASFPVHIGRGVEIRDSTTFSPAVSGLAAIVDGSRSLRIA